MYKKVIYILFLTSLLNNVYARTKEPLKTLKISSHKEPTAILLNLDPNLVKGDKNLVEMVENNTYLQHIEKLPDLEKFFPKFPDLAKKTVLLDMASHIAKETVQVDNQKKDALVFFLEKFLTHFSNKMTEKSVWRNTILDTLAPYAEDPKVLGILKAVYNDVSKDLSEKEKEDLLNHLTGKFNNTEIACLFKTASSLKSEEKIPPQKKSKTMNRDLK
ncbi:MAG: hypothetical protein BGO07_02290 [Alphaproteobacteria bacterium 40-19]|nr:MAG: hypothetical protein BGO07_02290 [Alphaproteobacteria bacterium 40-19]